MSGSRIVLVVTGPSGAGKSSVIRTLIALEPDLRFSVSHTTRPPRPDEREGVDYHFVSREVFQNTLAQVGFLEWAEVHGHLYGTSIAELDGARAEGKDMLLDIDVQGADQVASRIADAVSVFLLPPDFATLEARLRGRRSDPEDAVSTRLANAALEVRRCVSFGYIVVNEKVEAAAAEIRSILHAERLRTERRRELAARIVATFQQPPGVPK